MEIFVSDILFIVTFYIGLTWLTKGEIKLELQFGTSGSNRHVTEVFASKPILISGQAAKFIGLSVLLISGVCISQYKFGELLFML